MIRIDVTSGPLAGLSLTGMDLARLGQSPAHFLVGLVLRGCGWSIDLDRATPEREECRVAVIAGRVFLAIREGRPFRIQGEQALADDLNALVWTLASAWRRIETGELGAYFVLIDDENGLVLGRRPPPEADPSSEGPAAGG